MVHFTEREKGVDEAKTDIQFNLTSKINFAKFNFYFVYKIRINVFVSELLIDG